MNVWMHIEMFFLDFVSRSRYSHNIIAINHIAETESSKTHAYLRMHSMNISLVCIYSWANFTVEGIGIWSAILGLNIVSSRECAQVH
jgi:hypothetical protein